MHPNHEYHAFGSNLSQWGDRPISSKVYCDRGEDDCVAIYIEHKNTYYLYAVDLKHQPANKTLNLERYIAIYFAQSIGVKICELYINGIEPMEENLQEELNNRFWVVKAVIKGKLHCGVSGFRVTGELLYMLEKRRLYTPTPLQFTLHEIKRIKLCANDIINALNKPSIQRKAFNFISEEYKSPSERFSKAFFDFELRFFVRSFDILKIELDRSNINYDGRLVALSQNNYIQYEGDSKQMPIEVNKSDVLKKETTELVGDIPIEDVFEVDDLDFF